MMENLEIINLWKQYDEKLEKSLSLNKKILIELQQQKAKKALKPARNYKYIAVLNGLVYAGLIIYFFNYLHPFASIFVKVSVIIHLIVTLIAIGMYVRQLMLISEIDRSENVIHMQQKMATLQSSTLKVIGVCFLQLPVFITWGISFDLINNNPLAFWLIYMPLVVLFAYSGFWLYRNINIKNIEKKWLRMMFYGAEWNAILKSGTFIEELKEFEKS
ncbi:MAG: hypothetical protein EOO93_10805 [Pedobacter sp.]|nr:MAG: hypothetical protein EOO93_10805 [Pedobacter sp.]